MFGASAVSCSSGVASRSALCDIVSNHSGLRRGLNSQGSRANSWKVPAIVRTFRTNSWRAVADAVS